MDTKTNRALLASVLIIALGLCVWAIVRLHNQGNSYSTPVASEPLPYAPSPTKDNSPWKE